MSHAPAQAPLLHALTEPNHPALRPPHGQAWWITADDGVRLRMAHYPRSTPEKARGTVLLLPGRTEYIEKYGRVVCQLGAAGLDVAVLDVRGQGLADRVSRDPMLGHVRAFEDYQRDMSAFVDRCRLLELPRPWHLLCHSMGGAIGLRALTNGLSRNITSVVFSAPMWGIRMPFWLHPLAQALSWAAVKTRQSEIFAPGTKPESYLTTQAFDGNGLTTDEATYAWLNSHIAAEPKFGLGGPSMGWLNEALRENKAMQRIPCPEIPCLTLLGSDENIVDPASIKARMASWPGGKIALIARGRHEVLMEAPALREEAMSEMLAFLATHSEV